ncbi:MAG TPA: alpha/beta fold hydrolase, partial [Anaerolineales bacterium]|nr:alpha/beta fold hydrolase [Anaerolineales bacterium]
ETHAPAPIPTATPTPHPLQIEAMRAREYPGSDIVIEQVLDPGVNYSRYYVSYLSEGVKIYALMTVPDGEKPASGWPVIIFNHGFIPPDVYRTTERYVAYVDLIARSGFIVFRSDYRGHDQSEGEAGGAYSRPDYTVDVLNAVASMKRFPEADPNRIGMWGHSMGGYITLRSMVITGDIKAGVIWAGVVASYPDMLARWRRGSGAAVTPTPSARSWRYSLVNTYGLPEENPEFWNSISANSYLHDLSGPVQLHHGTADADVPLEFSELLFYQMLEAGRMVELYKYEGDNHNISNYFSLAMQRTVEFFDRYVK